MKKILFTILSLSLSVFIAKGQSLQQDTLDQKGLGNTQRLASGAQQDVLTNYIQLAAKNLTGTTSSLQLKLSLFALNPMDSASKYKNANFLHTAWQRNGELIFSGGLDKSNKLNSWQAGFNYNFLNRRDTNMHRYTVSYAEAFKEEGKIQRRTDSAFVAPIRQVLETKISAVMTSLYKAADTTTDIKKELEKNIPGMFHGGNDDRQIADKLRMQLVADLEANRGGAAAITGAMSANVQQIALYEANEAINIPVAQFMNGGGKKPLLFAPFISAQQTTAIGAYLDSLVKANPVLHGKLKANTMQEANKRVIRDYEQLVQYISRQPLLTFGYLYTNGTGTVLNSHVFGFTYFQGLGNFHTQKIGQIKASLTDTLTGNDPTGKIRNYERNIIALQVGYNQVLAAQNKKSVLEANFSGEADWATQGCVATNDPRRLYVNASVRGRLPSTPWLKLNLKYDPKAGKFLGLFDFTYNLDKQ